MVKYGTFSRLFNGNNKATAPTSGSAPASTEPSSTTPPTEPAQTTAPAKSNTKCLRVSLIVMLSSGVILTVGLLAGLLTRGHCAGCTDKRTGATAPNTNSSRPNIVFIMTDDQDRRLGSTDYQTVLQRELMAKGTEFTNHYTTQALCCPARSSLLRGQQVHNTNITNVVKPGWVVSPCTCISYQDWADNRFSGSYNKWVASGMDENYLPMWMNQAGYRTECKSDVRNPFFD